MNWHNLIKNGGQSLENRVGEDYEKEMVLEEKDKKLTSEHLFRTLIFLRDSNA